LLILLLIRASFFERLLLDRGMAVAQLAEQRGRHFHQLDAFLVAPPAVADRIELIGLGRGWT